MGAYNRVELPDEEICPNCGSRITRFAQFKYGDVWQHDYRRADCLVWERNNVGEAGHHRVTVSGHPESCPACGDVPDVRYEILVEDDRITGIVRADSRSEYSRFGHESFYVTDE
jgi:predicted RNA-binding Zn-ribbon protein involved in translation (DUF1610 family)